MNIDGAGAKPIRQAPLPGVAPPADASVGAAAGASAASSRSRPARARRNAAWSTAPPSSQAASRPRSVSTAASSAPIASGSSVRVPPRAWSSSVSRTWVRSVTAVKPNVAEPPLIEWAARKTTWIVSASPPPSSSASRPRSIASSPSRLSSKNAAWKRLMSIARISLPQERTLRIVATSWSGSNGLTSQPVAPAALPSVFLSVPDSVVSISSGVKR